MPAKGSLCRALAFVFACAAAGPAPAQGTAPAAQTENSEIPAFATPAFGPQTIETRPPDQAAAEAPTGPGLTVAILDLATAPDLLPAPAATVRPAWRTSFGSERQTAPEPKPTARDELLAALANVDAVLIHGVNSPRPLRRLFPPRHWRLIVSRHAASAKTAAPVATTAIAVKARPDLRVTARAFALRHIPMPKAEIAQVSVVPADEVTVEDSVIDAESVDLTSPVSGTIDDVVAASMAVTPVSRDVAASAADAPASHPATAVRLVARERAVWLAALALPRACAAEDPPCPALQELDLWRNLKRDEGEPALVGSRMNSDASAEAKEPACATYAIEADLGWHHLLPKSGGISPEPGRGCIVTLRIPQ